MSELNKFLFVFVDRNEQFAVVENPGFWNWTFTLKDGDDNALAEINRDWRGFGFEVTPLFLHLFVILLFFYKTIHINY